MKNIQRLQLGCMSMNRANRERATKTIRYALEKGITMFNTGEFYQQSESEIVLGSALEGVPRDKFQISVKYGMMGAPGGRGFYGIDVNPWNTRNRLLYSLKRLNLEYIDIYEPARQDENIPIEEVVGVLADLQKEGYIRHIGLSEVTAEQLRRACKVRPIYSAEVEYSLAVRGIENGLIQTAQKNGVKVTGFAPLAHGLINENCISGSFNPTLPSGIFAPGNFENNVELVKNLKALADEKGTTVSNLAIAWTLAKYDNVDTLIGTTSEAHLQDAINALSIELSAEDIRRIEAAFPAGAAMCRDHAPASAAAAAV